MELYGYQDRDARMMACRSGNLLAYEAGGGKTATYLRAAALRHPLDPWFICTDRNALQQHRDAISLWVPGKKNITLTHYEEAGKHLKAGVAAAEVILDEGDRACNVETETFKNLFPICTQSPFLRTPKGVTYATATPVHNGPKDLLAPLLLTGVFKMHQYNDALIYYCNPAWGGFGGGLDARGASNLGHLRQVLSKILIRKTYKDFGQPMPGISFENVAVVLDDSPAAAEARAATEDFKKWYRETHGLAVPPMAQYSIGRRLLAIAKAAAVGDALQLQLKAEPASNFLIFSEFREPMELLHKRFKGSGLVIGGDSEGGRGDVIQAAQASRGGSVTFATSGALQAAVNMQAVDRVHYVDLGWAPYIFDQTSKRAWRLLQKRAVKIYRFYVPQNPLENFIRDVNLEKEKVLALLGLMPTGSLTQFGLA